MLFKARTPQMSSKPFLSPDFPNAEAQRLYYLRLLGISSFYPRFILPGALPSTVYELQAPAVKETKQKTHQVVRPEIQTPGPTMELPKTEAPARPLPSRPKAQTPVPVAKAAREQAEGPSLQFQLVLLQTDAGLAVCNQIPAIAKAGMSDRELKLLGNILHWLGCPLRSGFTQRRFLWPMPGSVGADRQQAGRSLQAFLEQAHKEQAFTCLLMLGSSGTECLQEFGGAGETTAADWQQFSSHSLAEMLALPELKREAWQQLLPLHAMLAKRSA
jgi:hypothetical protein